MTYIIGGGISGLVLAECLIHRGENPVILSDSIGGQMSVTGFPLGPRILHKTEKVSDFLKVVLEKDLENYDQFSIAYYDHGKLKRSISEKNRQDYFEKTRGVKMKRNESCLSGGRNTIIGLDLDKINLVSILESRNQNRIRLGKVLGVNPDAKSIIFSDKNDQRCLSYDDLYSTIDLSIFQKLTQADQYSLSKKIIYYTLVKRTSSDNFTSYDFSYIYYVDDSLINRMTKVDDFYRVIESSHPISQISGYEIIKSASFPTQIQTELKLTEFKGVHLVGRYAQYDHSIKVNDIIEKFWR